MYMRGVILLMALAATQFVHGQSQVGIFASIRPGISTKAEVDLNLGDPLRKLEENIYVYPPPRSTADSDHIVVQFFGDTRQVARVDVYLKAPLDPEVLRAQFGTRVMMHDREASEVEELYYPKLNGLIFAGRTAASGAQTRVTAIAYMSPRLMADLFVERSQSLRRENRLGEAQTEADKAVLVDADYARGYLEQAECWIGLKNENEAMVSFIAATKAKYNALSLAAAHVRLGELYWRSRNWGDKALVEFQQAIALEPDSDNAHLRYAQYLRGQNQPDQAVAEFSAAIRLNSGNLDAHHDLADLHYARSEFSKAEIHYGALSTWAETPASRSADSAKAEWHYRFGVCLSKDKKANDAVAAYQKALKRNPQFAPAWLGLGNEYQAMRDWDKALDSYRSGLKASPKDFPLSQALGNTLLEKGPPASARGQIEQALQMKPDDAQQRFYMARCWAALGKKNEAVRWIRQAVAAGFQDRARLTGDRFLAPLQKDGEFKKILQQIS